MRAPLRTILLLLVAVAVAASATYVEAQSTVTGPTNPIPPGGGQTIAPSGSVTLRATPAQPSFTAGSPITIALSLVNNGGTSVALSNAIEGNVVVTSFTRDGAPVALRTTAFDPDDDLATILGQRLTPVSPGGTLSLTWSSANDVDLGGQALQSVAVQSAGNVATIYGVNAPGSYTLSLYYQYAGTGGGSSSPLYLGPTNVATATFTVTP